MTAKQRPKHDKDSRDSADAERKKREKSLDQALSDTFPASDPVSAVQPAPPAEELP